MAALLPVVGRSAMSLTVETEFEKGLGVEKFRGLVRSDQKLISPNSVLGP